MHPSKNEADDARSGEISASENGRRRHKSAIAQASTQRSLIQRWNAQRRQIRQQQIRPHKDHFQDVKPDDAQPPQDTRSGGIPSDHTSHESGDTDEFLAHVQGSLRLSVEDHVELVKSGDAVCVPLQFHADHPRVPYIWLRLPEKQWEDLCEQSDEGRWKPGLWDGSESDEAMGAGVPSDVNNRLSENEQPRFVKGWEWPNLRKQRAPGGATHSSETRVIIPQEVTGTNLGRPLFEVIVVNRARHRRDWWVDPVRTTWTILCPLTWSPLSTCRDTPGLAFTIPRATCVPNLANSIFL